MRRVVRAEVVRRYVFNFRLRPEDAAAMLPVRWLEPALVDGSAIFSFCPYVLHRLTVGRVPAWLGLRAVCAAYRLAVVEHTAAGPRPAVWVPGRSASSKLVTWGARWWLHTPRFEHITARRREPIRVHEYARAGSTPFRAVLGPRDRSSTRASRAFTDDRDFGCFMSSGTSSLAPSRREGELVRIDLDAQGTRWEQLPVVDAVDDLVPSSATFESAFVGHGGSYTWWLAA